jgi:alkylhydroperoxidase family enzyme
MTDVDGVPRLALGDLDGGLQELLKPTVDRLGYLGEFFGVTGHVPNAVSAFMQYTAAVKAPLSDAQNEMLALAVCGALGADYERIQHERLARRLGQSVDWIAAAEGRPGANPSALDADALRLQRLALAMVARNGERCTAEIRAVADALGPTKTVAALLQITRFVTIATLCNALALTLPVPSIFDEQGTD